MCGGVPARSNTAIIAAMTSSSEIGKPLLSRNTSGTSLATSHPRAALSSQERARRAPASPAAAPPLPRTLPVAEPADLFVLIRCVDGRPLRERLADKGLDAPGPRDLDSLPMRLDFLLSPRGEALPLALVVELRTRDFECDEPRRRFRVYHGQDSPLLQFWVRPLRPASCA